MPNIYIKKAERERQARLDKSVQTLLAICDDPKATPETKLGAVKQLNPIWDREQRISERNEQLSERDEEILKLKKQLETEHSELETARNELATAAQQLEAVLEDTKTKGQKIEQLESDKKQLVAERAHWSEQLSAIRAEKDAATKRTEYSEAEVKELIPTLKILADEFVQPQDRHSTALRQFTKYSTQLSRYWYAELDLSNALRYEGEIKKLKELMAQARKQERPLLPYTVYLESDAECFGNMFLYELLLDREKWLQKSLVDFFKSEGADYSTWLRWYSDAESSVLKETIETKRFCDARQAYNDASRLGGSYLILHKH
jgi:chromosome segregation ATPase